jgi:hypothetical protein
MSKSGGSALNIGSTQDTTLHFGTRDMVCGDWRDLMTAPSRAGSGLAPRSLRMGLDRIAVPDSHTVILPVENVAAVA